MPPQPRLARTKRHHAERHILDRGCPPAPCVRSQATPITYIALAARYGTAPLLEPNCSHQIADSLALSLSVSRTHFSASPCIRPSVRSFILRQFIPNSYPATHAPFHAGILSSIWAFIRSSLHVSLTLRLLPSTLLSHFCCLS